MSDQNDKPITKNTLNQKKTLQVAAAIAGMRGDLSSGMINLTQCAAKLTQQLGYLVVPKNVKRIADNLGIPMPVIRVPRGQGTGTAHSRTANQNHPMSRTLTATIRIERKLDAIMKDLGVSVPDETQEQGNA